MQDVEEEGRAGADHGGSDHDAEVRLSGRREREADHRSVERVVDRGDRRRVERRRGVHARQGVRRPDADEVRRGAEADTDDRAVDDPVQQVVDLPPD